MGQFAAAYKLARPHRHRDTGLQSQLALDATVQLRLRKKSARSLEDVIGPAQLLVLSLKLLEPAHVHLCSALVVGLHLFLCAVPNHAGC